MTFHPSPLYNDDPSIFDFGIQSLHDSKMVSPLVTMEHKRLFTKDSRHLISKHPEDSFIIPKTISSQFTHIKPSYFRMIVCGDSGIGKSALVHALSATPISERNNSTHDSYEPIEVMNPANNICMIDTVGYGSILQADVIFTHVKSYIEKQYEKTNMLFNPGYTDDDGSLSYIVYQSADTLTHIDACLYLIMGRLKHVDIEYMRKIHHLINIIPVIIQLDLSVRAEVVREQRMEIISALKSNNIQFCTFGDDDSVSPFVLNWSSTKKDSSLHGLNNLRNTICNQYPGYLRQYTTDKYIQWRQNEAARKLNFSSSATSPDSSACSSNSSSSTNVKVSRFLTQRRHTLEKEMLIEEKKLRDELESADKMRRTELILNELNKLVKEDDNLIQFNQGKMVIQPHSVPQKYVPWTISLFLLIIVLYHNIGTIYP
ncbi:Septin-domain-containing protein [Pilobolus umbonatus]|nr:Septin-domain-containing protein [Pilobolus umbonatus]